jgi:hypothetical protein
MKDLVPPFSAESIPTHGVQHATADQGLKAMPIVWTEQTGMMHLSRRTLEQCLVEELNVSRLSNVYQHLWWAGRPVAARSLSRQRMCRREVVVTEQADLHLTWSDTRIFIKPLPAYLLNYNFWKTYLCGNRELHESARGFLLSYVWLVRHESDFTIAKEHGLLPDDMEWDAWGVHVASMACQMDFNNLYCVDKRYTYGELRLNRLNHIYRFAPQFKFRHLILGYASNHHTYGSFFRKNFAWLVVFFAYGSTLLSALQVGLATDELSTNASFQDASYGFTVLAIIFPLSIALLVGLLYVVLFLFHLSRTLVFEKKKALERKRWMEEKVSI